MGDQDLCKRAIAKLAVQGPKTRPSMRLWGGDAPVLKRIEEDLVVAYVVDQGDHYLYLQRRHLRAEGFTEAELHRTALANLPKLLDHHAAALFPDGDVFRVTFDGHFDASLILFDALWDDAFADFAPNGFVVAVPNRDILPFADAQSQAGLAELERIVERGRPWDHPISNKLYRRDAARRTWYPFRSAKP